MYFLSRIPDFLLCFFQFGFEVLIRIFARRDINLFFSNVERVYGLPRHSSFATLFFKQCLHHQVKCQTETILGIYNPGRVEIEDGNQLKAEARKLLSLNKGLIVVTAHLGSWEFVAKYTGELLGRPFFALAKPSSKPIITNFLQRLRARMNTKVLWTGKPSLLKEMIKTVKSGEILGFVMDQKPAGRIGPVAEFLGQPTEFVTGPASLALKCGTPVLGVYCTRTSPWHYQMHSKTLYVPDSAVTKDQTAEELTELFASNMSSMIRAYPEQWTWSYKRWRDR